MKPPIELLPRDEATLSKDDEQILSVLYDRFDQSNAPVPVEKVAVALKGKVIGVPRRLASQELGQYVRRWDSKDEFTPTLRAAIRLWKEHDLRDAWRLYDACYDAFSETNQHHRVPMERLTAELHGPHSLRRMGYLLDWERFLSFETQGQERVVVAKLPVLDAQTLAGYLAVQNSGVRPTKEPELLTRRAHLEQVELTNLRSFRKATVGELGPLTVFAGPNEAGKSNLLRALKFAAGVATNGLEALRDETERLRRAETGAELDIRLTLKESESERRWYYEVSSTADGIFEETLHEADGSEQPKPRLLSFPGAVELWDDKRETLDLVTARGESALHSLQDLGRFRSLIELRGTLSRWSFFHFEVSPLRSPLPRRDGRLAPDGSNLPAALLSLGERNPEAWKEVAKAFHSLLPETEELQPQRSLAGNALLSLRERGLTNPLRHVDFSDGMLRILALLTLAFDPHPPPLVVIEEPENGLYPRLIEALVEVLRQLSKKTQVIVTTHSVTLLNQLIPEEVVFVYRDDHASKLQRADSREDIKAFFPRMGLGTQMLVGNVEDRD